VVEPRPGLREERGWRLDYQVITPRLKPAVIGASIYTDERFSDHAPQIMEYALALEP
jgi:exodeoxyribonuclease-3